MTSEELRLVFERSPAEQPCYAKCVCCREAEVKSLLKSVETEIRLRLQRGDKFVGMGPLVS